MKDDLRLILDIQSVQSVAHGERGIARYTQSLVEGLLSRSQAVRGLMLNPGLALPCHLRRELRDSGLLRPGTKSSVDSLLSSEPGSWVYVVLSPFELMPNQEPFYPSYLQRGGLKLAVVLYDLIPLLHEDAYLTQPLMRRMYHQRLRLIRRADLVMTISESARQDALAFLGLDPQRVVTIGTGIDETFSPEPVLATVENEGVRELVCRKDHSYLLTLMGEDPRKNLEGLLKAYSGLPESLRAETPLVVAGKYREESQRMYLEASPLKPEDWKQVVFTGMLSDADLKHLYQHAALFIFPSIYEGFGLPAAEAAACGCPVVVSNTSSLPEVIGWEPATFDPHNPDEMGRIICRALTDEAFASELRRVASESAIRHRWPHVVDRTLGALQGLSSLVPSSPGQVKSGGERLRLALVGPLAPAKSGIATYNTLLIKELEQLCDVDVYVPDALSFEAPSPFRKTKRMLLESLTRTRSASEYDLVIYTMGNSSHHVTSLQLFRKCPGVVWMHDARLSGLYYMEACTSVSPPEVLEWLQAYLEKEFSTEFERGMIAQEVFSAAHIFLEKAPPMTREVFRKSLAVVVHSAQAEQMIREENPEIDTPVYRIPLAADLRLPGNQPVRDDPKWIVVFGTMGPAKAPEKVARIFGQLIREFPDLRLAFVGAMDEGSKMQIFEECRTLEVPEDKLVFTGFVERRDYEKWLSRADLAIFRRERDNGESSAAANDCLSAGVPLLSNIPSQAEYPDTAVRKLAFDASEEEWEKTILHLLNSPEERQALQQAGSAYAEEISFRKVAENFLRICRELKTTQKGEGEKYFSGKNNYAEFYHMNRI
ncbi:MAG: glycosyltransferase [Kiritimatiellia bacterium]